MHELLLWAEEQRNSWGGGGADWQKAAYFSENSFSCILYLKPKNSNGIVFLGSPSNTFPSQIEICKQLFGLKSVTPISQREFSLPHAHHSRRACEDRGIGQFQIPL